MTTTTKNILGLDLGTNSIGWALINKSTEEHKAEIKGLGSRIIPMSQDVIGEFDKGNSISQTAERTRLRSVRRLKERHLLRRERLHRVLHILGFLPKHYDESIDFEKRKGKFLPETETKLAYNAAGKFLFMDSFEEMLELFRSNQPELVANNKKVPYDWTIYYLRKKALTQKISNEELAWLILNFNQKRGYYQLRGEESEEKSNKVEEFHTLKIVDVVADELQKGKSDIWYNVILENGWVYRRESKFPIFDWKDKVRDFIVTTEIKEDGTIKTDKEGKEKRTFRSPKDDDWKLMKKKTEYEIKSTKKTVGEYIFDSILSNPNQKIKGKLVRTIERDFYKEEFLLVLKKQIELNPILQNKSNYSKCIEELYPHNFNHQTLLEGKDFLHLFADDIIFYQRPLRSQKALISNCSLETKAGEKDGVEIAYGIKCIPKSHPLYQEFRLWGWISNLRIINKHSDTYETSNFLKTREDYESLFNFLNERKEIDQKALLGKFKLKENKFRWNYVEDKKYPCNETGSMLKSRLEKIGVNANEFLNSANEFDLWHIIYSVSDKEEYKKALIKYANKHKLNKDAFVDAFLKFPPFPSNYGSYSAKAIKKLLPLMRTGRYWNECNIDESTKNRIELLLSGEFEMTISDKVREVTKGFNVIADFQCLPEWLAKYIVYNRHSEIGATETWETSVDLDNYIKALKQHTLRNPIVEQVVNESLKVVRDIWVAYGKGCRNFFDEIHIELGREMKHTASERKKISENVTRNENTNYRIKLLLAEMLNDNEVENVRPYSPMQQEILKIYEQDVLCYTDALPDDIAKISKMRQPSKGELQRYKLWLDQKYRSPYTGSTIPLSKLFTPDFEIEHIIPQSRYFDDSLSNKVICEAAVNKLKSNQTGLEFIKNHRGEVVDLGFGKKAVLLTEETYRDLVSKNFENNRAKRSKLLTEELPEKMIERQLNDTRYISSYIMQLLSRLVRADQKDEGMVSKNVIAFTGQITSRLKKDWGLEDVWNDILLPRFERLNALFNTNHFTTYNERYQKFLPTLPLEMQKGFQKKRLDHRHHALDALVIASATRNHVNYLNNTSALEKGKSKTEREKTRYDLRAILCEKHFSIGNEGNYEWVFKKPWERFIPETKQQLDSIIVSFKQNQRIINTSNNYYEKIEGGKKINVKQAGKANLVIRKSLHKDTVFGETNLQKIRTLGLTKALELPKNIVDSALRRYILNELDNGNDANKLLKAFKEMKYMFNNKKIDKVEVYYQDTTNVATRKTIDSSFDKTKIDSITDSGIRKILSRHLEENGGNEELAFSPEGIDTLNKNIVRLNDGKTHKPIYKARVYETRGNKFSVGESGNKMKKFVEADKGTNLFFAIYKDVKGKRSFETIPLNIVVERLKQGLNEVPEINANGSRLLMSLTVNDLVYIPSEEDYTIHDLKKGIDRNRIYKFVSCTGSEAHFVLNSYSKEILINEQGTNNKSERMLHFHKFPALFDEKGKPQIIKNICWKLKIDRLGNIVNISK